MRERRIRTGAASLVGVLGLLGIPNAEAAPASLTYRAGHLLYTVNVPAEWTTPSRSWTFNGQPINPPAELLVDGDEIPAPPPGFAISDVPGINRQALRATLESKVRVPFRRDPGTVKISWTGTGKAVFEGAGLTGRDVDMNQLVELTVTALEQGIEDIYLPVTETQPTMTIDPALRNMGITEVVTVGESDFSNSPRNRIHNINTGLDKFDGHLIQPSETFSFVETLGPVDGRAGFLRELVIKGDRTVPDYGGGLCQVSSTAYRGVWEAGLPIASRRNHSYVVNHYSPVGTDATIYLPQPDMRFTNDTAHPLLMQTHTVGDTAYFIYYGTKKAQRDSLVIGPFIWDRTSPPADRVEYTADLAPGQKKVIGQRVPGMKVKWFRLIWNGAAEPDVEEYYSHYQARPYFTQVGQAAAPATGEGTAGLEAGDVEAPVLPNGED